MNIMSTFNCRLSISAESLPRISISIASLDGKGKNEFIRMLMRMSLLGIQYPLKCKGSATDSTLRLKVTKASHQDLYSHLSQFPARLRSAEILRLLLCVENESINITVSPTIRQEDKKVIEETISENRDYSEQTDIIINEDDVLLADML